MQPGAVDPPAGPLQYQLFDGERRPTRDLVQSHPRVSRRPPALFPIARLTGAHQIFPAALAAQTARHHVIDGQLRLGLAAILASVAVAGEDLPASQLYVRRRPPDVVLELDDRRTDQPGGRRSDVSRVPLQDLGLALFDENESASKMTDIQRRIILIEN